MIDLNDRFSEKKNFFNRLILIYILFGCLFLYILIKTFSLQISSYWDQNGDQLNSEDLSRFILNCQQNDRKIIFLIGGSFGLSDVIKNRSNKIFSASLLTFPHRLFRLILMEQIYRAHSIITNMPYHK